MVRCRVFVAVVVTVMALSLFDIGAVVVTVVVTVVVAVVVAVAAAVFGAVVAVVALSQFNCCVGSYVV